MTTKSDSDKILESPVIGKCIYAFFIFLLQAQQHLDLEKEEAERFQHQVEEIKSCFSCETEKCDALTLELQSRETELQLNRDYTSKLEGDINQMKDKIREKVNAAP